MSTPTAQDKEAALLLSRARTALGMSQGAVSVRVSMLLGDGVVSRDWVHRMEAGPSCPLQSHRQTWALLEVLGIHSRDYLEALGLPVPDMKCGRPLTKDDPWPMTKDDGR